MTHTLTGLALAEAAIQARTARRGSSRALSASWRTAAYLTSALANNVPDFDLLLSPLTAGKLGYLLHHRGYTHTLALTLPQAALVLLAPALYARARLCLWGARDWCWLAALSLIGVVVHMLLDYGNSYGVHLLWPFDGRWSYGDSVFIVEPGFWLALVPMLFYAVRSGVARVGLALLFIAALAAELASGFVPQPIGLAFAAMGVGLWLVAPRLGARGRLVAAASAYAAVMALFYGAAGVARDLAARTLAAAFPGWRTADQVLSPLASDPVCHTLIAVQVDDKGGYALRRATVSIAPWLVAAADCPRLFGEGRLALTPLAAPAGLGEVRWEGGAELSLAKLKEVYEGRCEARAFFRFGRAPFYLDDAVGDLRFDRGGPGFAEIPFRAPGAPCPERVPDWAPPRADVLGL